MASRSLASNADKAEALQNMDLVRILRAYVLAAIASTTGYKALVLDKETMRILSTMFGRSELAENNVIHIERLDAAEVKEQPHPELKVSQPQ
jgi:vacuolar protein sorting-associated protein 45